jgi:hypothetical protein
MSAQHKCKPAGVLRLEARRAEAIIARIAQAGEAGLVTTTEELAADLGEGPMATRMGIRDLRKQGRIELTGEKGQAVILLRVLGAS